MKFHKAISAWAPVGVLCLLALTVAACVPVTAPASAGIANPASENCIKLGGDLVIETREDGGQFGVCYFEDNLQCEEWALFRGECPEGGVKVTGYATPAGRYCAITGGTYTVTGNSGAEDEQGVCALPNGVECDAWAHYDGTCSAEATGAAYDDPFAYCAAVGTIDAPDAQYAGPAMPESVVQGLRTAMSTPDAPPEMFEEGRAFWRCMDGHVYGCAVGANIPCMEKADPSQEPSAEMAEFCQQNPGAEVIPAYVTGRATVYAWGCEDATPVPGDPVAEIDAQGFNRNFWYELPAP